MSKRENYTQRRRQSRCVDEDNFDGGREKMLGRKSRMNWGNGPSRLPAKVVHAMLREAADK